MQNKRSKYANLGQRAPQGQDKSISGQDLKDLERVRDGLMENLLKYKELLESKVLLSNKTEMEKKELKTIVSVLGQYASELDTKNIGEGSSTLNAAALNCILLLHGQVNELRWRVYELHKRIDDIEGVESEEG